MGGGGNHLNNEMLSIMIHTGMKVVGIAENIHIFIDKTTSAMINNFIVQMNHKKKAFYTIIAF